MTKQLSVACLFAAVLLCRANPVDPGSGPASQFAVEAQRAAAKAQRAAARIARKVSEQPVVRRSPVVGRRLENDFPDVKFSEMCNSACWMNISTGITKMYSLMNSPECRATFNHRRLQESEESEPGESDCIFDSCDQQTMPCDWFTHDPRLDIPPEQLDPTNKEFNFTAMTLNFTVGMMLDHPCVRPSIEFTCHGVCSQSCMSNNKNERKMFCPGDAEGDSHHERRLPDGTPPPGGDGNDHHDGTPPPGGDGNDHHDDKDDKDDDMSPEDMATMFNMLCLKSDDFYCYDKIKEDTEKGAWSEDGPADTFPDPCNIDCSTPTAQAIKELGCCFASLMDASHRTGMMSTAELRLAKAGAAECAPKTAMTLCGHTPVETLLTVVNASLPMTCADLARRERQFTEVFTEETGDQADITVLTCQDRSCDGRRLQDTDGKETSRVKVLLVTKGQDRADKASRAQNMVQDEQTLAELVQKASSGDSGCVQIPRKTLEAAKAKGFTPMLCKG